MRSGINIGPLHVGNKHAWKCAWVMRAWFGIFRNRPGVIPGRWGFYILAIEFGSRNPGDRFGTWLKRVGLWPW